LIKPAARRMSIPYYGKFMKSIRKWLDGGRNLPGRLE